MAEIRTTTAAAPRPLLCRMLSFREPLLVIPYLLGFLGAAASAFFGSYSSFLQSFARSSSLFPPAAAAKCASCAYSTTCGDADDAPCHAAGAENEQGAEAEEEEDAPLSREEVEAIMVRIGVAPSGGRGLAAMMMGRDEVSRLFDAEEPSFAEVRSAFAVFDEDRDGFIGVADLQGALARLGVREDAAACRAMIAAAGGGKDGRMSLFQFVAFLETGLC